MKRAGASAIIGLALIAGAARSIRRGSGLDVPSRQRRADPERQLRRRWPGRTAAGRSCSSRTWARPPAWSRPIDRSEPRRDVHALERAAPARGEPAVVPVSGGGLRMYYVASTARSGATEIDSATSSDGLSWTVEPGTRLVIDTPAAVVAPEAVVLPNGGAPAHFVTGPGPSRSTARPQPTASASPPSSVTGSRWLRRSGPCRGSPPRRRLADGGVAHARATGSASSAPARPTA